MARFDAAHRLGDAIRAEAVIIYLRNEISMAETDITFLEDRVVALNGRITKLESELPKPAQKEAE